MLAAHLITKHWLNVRPCLMDLSINLEKKAALIHAYSLHLNLLDPKGIEVPGETKAYSYDRSFSYDDDDDDQVQFDCNGRAVTEELDLYTQLLAANNKTKGPHSQYTEYFVNQK